MPTISITVPPEVGDALTRQARALLLGRRQYIRALLAAVAAAEADIPQATGAQSVTPELPDIT